MMSETVEIKFTQKIDGRDFAVKFQCANWNYVPENIIEIAKDAFEATMDNLEEYRKNKA